MKATITRIDDGRFPAQHRYRIEGTDISPEWAESLERRARAFPNEQRPAVPYCEFTIWYQGNQLGSYGGEVWPMAWPLLFESHRGTAQTGSYTLLTAKGLGLVAEAERAWERLHADHEVQL
jgi:hypothetical protein